jgi:hypothetical protein
MRNLCIRMLILLAAGCLAAFLRSGTGQADNAPALSIEPFVWQLNVDYGEDLPTDELLPVNTVYIKTHDGTDWMSTYDNSPDAISGPDALRNVVASYRAKGINVVAWFAPIGTDYDTQVRMAEEVIDSGVSALYADMEPFDGFCDQDCVALGQYFWPRVRADRPNARLGVIYVPLPRWRDVGDTAGWMANADVALPMCYWVDFEDEGPFSDPAGCVNQSYVDLFPMVGHHFDYIPILSGDGTGAQVKQAMDAAVALGSTSVSLWRRGTVHEDVWNAISAYPGAQGLHCAAEMADGCIVREVFQPQAFVIAGGAKLALPNETSAALSHDAIEIAPIGVVNPMPTVPRDGTLIREAGSDDTYVIYGGGRFRLTPSDFAALTLDPSKIILAPAGATSSLPSVPTTFAIVKPIHDAVRYLVHYGYRIPLDMNADAELVAAGLGGLQTYVLPEAAIDAIPIENVRVGDVDCTGKIDGADVRNLLIAQLGGTPAAVCLNIAGDVNCDAAIDSRDALALLQYVSGSLDKSLADFCPKIGAARAAEQPQRVLDSIRATPTPTSTPSPTPTGTPSPTPSLTVRRTPSVTPTNATSNHTPTAKPSASPRSSR